MLGQVRSRWGRVKWVGPSRLSLGKAGVPAANPLASNPPPARNTPPKPAVRTDAPSTCPPPAKRGMSATRLSRARGASGLRPSKLGAELLDFGLCLRAAGAGGPEPASNPSDGQCRPGPLGASGCPSKSRLRDKRAPADPHRDAKAHSGAHVCGTLAANNTVVGARGPLGVHPANVENMLYGHRTTRGAFRSSVKEAAARVPHSCTCHGALRAGYTSTCALAHRLQQVK